MNVFHFRRSGVAGGPMKVREANRKMGVIIKKRKKGTEEKMKEGGG